MNLRHQQASRHSIGILDTRHTGHRTFHVRTRVHVTYTRLDLQNTHEYGRHVGTDTQTITVHWDTDTEEEHTDCVTRRVMAALKDRPTETGGPVF